MTSLYREYPWSCEHGNVEARVGIDARGDVRLWWYHDNGTDLDPRRFGSEVQAMDAADADMGGGDDVAR